MTPHACTWEKKKCVLIVKALTKAKTTPVKIQAWLNI